MAGVLIRTFLADGTPDGLRTYEVSNATVHATVFPRPALDRFLRREAANRPGVYVLVGRDPDGDATRVYIGEGDPTAPRLRAHGGNKDFWTQAAVFTSKDDYLTKTQVQFLEARLVAETKTAGRAKLDNGNVPTEPRVSEADQAEVEGFLVQVRLLLGAAGFDFLKSREAVSQPVPAPATAIASAATDVFVYRVREAEARLVRTPTSYTVLNGSTALADSRPSAGQWTNRLRDELLATKILVPAEGNLLRFTKDTEFESASAAASVTAGGSVNGRIVFKRADGLTLRDVEEANVEHGTGSASLVAPVTPSEQATAVRAGFCPRHEGEPVVGMCRRCDAFVCARDSVTANENVFCRDCAASEDAHSLLAGRR